MLDKTIRKQIVKMLRSSSKKTVVIDKRNETDYIIVSILTMLGVLLLCDMENRELWQLKD